MTELAPSLPEEAPAVPASGEGIAVERVRKRFGTTLAVDDVSLTVEKGAFVALLGPSGCGKTTLLRLVAGFETPDDGRIRLGGRDVTARPPQDRPTAMVFQSYALFPKLSVGQNVGYGLSVRKRPRAETAERVAAALGRVGLDGFTDRAVSTLSGGQQQRVALARALAVEPEVLLFDEPLSNLDQALREQTRRELKTLQRTLGTTALYVTHDQQEALALADHLALMRDGRIVEQGPPERLYAEPETAFTARFLGGTNLVEDATLAARLSPDEPRRYGHALAIRPTSLRVATEGQRGAVPARLVARQFLGPFAEWLVETEGGTLRLWTNAEASAPERLFVRAAAARWVRADG